MAFDPSLHPRDSRGRFITKGAAADELKSRLGTLKGAKLDEAKALIARLGGGTSKTTATKPSSKKSATTKPVKSAKSGKERLAEELNKRAEANKADSEKAKQFNHAADALANVVGESGIPYTPNSAKVEYIAGLKRQQASEYLEGISGKTPSDEEISSKIVELDSRLQGMVDDSHQFIAFTPDTLESVLNSGRVKTQFETGKSGGWYNPESRAEAENAVAGVPRDIDPKLRPNYGYLSSHADGGEANTDSYGMFKAKLVDSVRSRSTVTFGDSLAAKDQVFVSPLDKISSNSARSLKSESLWEATKVQDTAQYAETQIHGGLSAKEIESVSVSKSWADANPTRVAAVAKKLKGSGIPLKITNTLD